jgi:2-polyprenyl-3-methyl-5-hydroxy-6-metoxy-1,4-benzoquinol methylase
MRLGPFIRALFGPFERSIGEAYRSLYIDLEEFTRLMLRWRPRAERILEVGCGEGAVTERLAQAYPNAGITAVDITPRLGRLYRGPTDRVEFRRCTVQEIAAREAGAYDLAVLSDVLHHVPREARQAILDSIRAAVAPGGALIFKDWQKSRTPIHWLCHASDRWLTGDRVVYMTREEMRWRLSNAFGEQALIAEARVLPRWNNLATLVRVSG